MERRFSVAVVVAFIAACPSIHSQRQVPPPRDPLGGQINYAPSRLRGSGFFLANQVNFEHLWSNIVPGQPTALSMPSIENQMAHLARSGFNSIRIWSSYAGYLYHHHVATPNLDYAARVKELLDRADVYELGAQLVLFNTVGAITGGNLTGACPAPNTSEGIQPAPSPFTQDWVQINVRANPGGPTDLIHCWSHFVSPPYTPAFLGIQADLGPLFSYNNWKSNAQSVGHMQDYLNRLLDDSQGGIARHNGLWGIQLYNEPAKVAYSVFQYGDVVKTVLGRVKAYNADNVFVTVGAEARIIYAQPEALGGTPAWSLDLIGRGLTGTPTPGSEMDQFITAWNIHTTLDPWVRIDIPSPDRFSTYYQARYMTATGTPGGGLGWENMLADLGNQYNGAVAFQFRGAMSDEVGHRATTFQTLNDVALFTINPTTIAPGARLGLIAWSAFPGDLAGRTNDQSAMFLPGGTVIGPRELETIRDNWKKDTSTNAPANAIATDYSDAIVPAMATSGDGRAVLVIWADNWDPKAAFAKTTPPAADPTERRLFYKAGIANAAAPGGVDWWGSTAAPHPVLDSSPGPLVFDLSRQANNDFSDETASACGKDANWSDVVHPEIEQNLGPADSDPPACCEPSVRPYARMLLERQRLKSTEVIMEPSVVYQKFDATANEYVFWVAWSRPVTVSDNPNERYYPDDQGSGGGFGADGRYFNVFQYRGGNGTGPAPSPNRAKYEVLVAEVRVPHDHGGTPTPHATTPQVIETRGSYTSGSNRPTDPGAAAI